MLRIIHKKKEEKEKEEDSDYRRNGMRKKNSVMRIRDQGR